MTDESLDDLISLYRQAARETSSKQADIHILQFAARRKRRDLHGALVWSAVAAASCMTLWLTIHHVAPKSKMTPAIATETAPPGSTDGSDRLYLMQMDVSPASSQAAQYLMSEAQPNR